MLHIKLILALCGVSLFFGIAASANDSATTRYFTSANTTTHPITLSGEIDATRQKLPAEFVLVRYVGNRIMSVWQLDNGAVVNSQEYVYDATGALSEKRTRAADGVMRVIHRDALSSIQQN